MVEPHSGVWDFTSNTSGTANVKTGEDCGWAGHSGRSWTWTPISGTTGPSQAWFQSGLAGVPLFESTAFFSGKNSLYTIPANTSVSPVQSSGSANVPKSESTVGH